MFDCNTCSETPTRMKALYDSLKELGIPEEEARRRALDAYLAPEPKPEPAPEKKEEAQPEAQGLPESVKEGGCGCADFVLNGNKAYLEMLKDLFVSWGASDSEAKHLAIQCVYKCETSTWFEGADSDQGVSQSETSR